MTAGADDVYSHGHHDSVLRSHRWRTAENSAAYLLPRLSPGTTVLDVGCGPGTLTADLAARVAPGRVVGVDIAADVVDEARAHVRARGLGNVELLVGDFRDLDLGSGAFDVVHAHQVLQHLSDPVGALAVMARLARPCGSVAVRDGDYSSMTWAPPSEALDRWLALCVAVARRNGGDPDAGRHLPARAQAAGLTATTYTTSTWTFASAPERTWWADMWAERTVTSALGDQAVAYGLADRADLAGIAAGWRAWACQPDGVFIVLNGELLATV